MHSKDQGWRNFLRSCWETAFVKARCPVKGVVLPQDKVTAVVTRVFRQAGRQFDADSKHAEFAAFVVGNSRIEALATIAEERKLSGDHDRYRNRDAQSYDYGENPDFDQMKSRDHSGVLNSPELQRLFPALRPIAINTFRKYGTSDRDGEEVFSNCLQKLTMPKKKTGVSPIEELTVFEEVFPFFNKLVQNESVNRIRQVAALKNQANVQASIEALEDSETNPVQFADPATQGTDDAPDFDEIYKLCADSLDELEWRLVAALYMDQGMTKNALLKDEELMAELGLSDVSPISRWRGVSKKLGFALTKMRKRLEEENYFFGNAANKSR
ncbi:MAG: hypothetical protein R3F19_09645 [Verrucomicrobiales bacterium]